MVRTDLLAAVCAVTLSACMPQKNIHPDVHGHRGCRGLLPENTIPAFLKATDLGCDFLEMDVVISADGQVVVSHEPWMDHLICLDPNGDPIAEANERSHNLYRMSAAEIRTYDCGSLEHPDFPEQDQRKAFKPLLRNLIELVDEHALLSGVAPPSFNIELKSDSALYGSFQPDPVTFVGIVLGVIDEIGIGDRCILQSFDPAILEALHRERPEIPLAFLVEDDADLGTQLARLTFPPAIYSPHFTLADTDLLSALRARNIELVVWTVNEPADIKGMLDLGVDGIISDYPDRVFGLLDGRE